MTAPVVEAVGLTKDYGRHRGLDDLTLTVERGEVFGFLGPNGAGKSTTIRLLLDLIRPTAGTVLVLGVSPRTGHDLRRRIGYLPGELRLEGRQTAGDLLGFFAGISGGVAPDAIHALAERLGLDLSRQIRGLSKGNKQKVGIVQAFMHRPELLILDEPTSGLDPLVQQEFLTLVREARDAGQTVFMSSHVMSEVEDVADRVGIIREGRLVFAAGLHALRTVRRYDVRFADAVTEDEFAGTPNVHNLDVDGLRLRCDVDGSVDPLLKAIARHTVVSLRADDPDLEELFLTHYRDTAATERQHHDQREVHHVG